MIKKKIIMQAPKRDIASIINTVKPEAKMLSKSYKMKTAPKIAEPKPSEMKKPVMIKPALKIASVQKRTLPKEKIMQSKDDKAAKKTRINDNIAEVPPENEAYFVYLKNPLEYRRCLLECSRKILFCLRSHQRLLIIRQKKLEGMARLKICIKELLYINKKFNEKLPKYDMTFFENTPKAEKIQAKPMIEPKILSARKPEPKREKTELERLEDSLANIENKLKNLQ